MAIRPMNPRTAGAINNPFLHSFLSQIDVVVVLHIASNGRRKDSHAKPGPGTPYNSSPQQQSSAPLMLPV